MDKLNAILKEQEKKHLRNLLLSELRLKRLFNDSTIKIRSLMEQIDFDLDKLDLSNYPRLENFIDKQVTALNREIYKEITSTTASAWNISQDKNTQILELLVSTKKLNLSDIEPFLNPNFKALQAFNNRLVQGLNLSERVWNISKQFKDEVAESISAMILDGKGAERVASSSKLRDYLNYPNKRFRRIRDERGILHLSNNAKNFHPGRGVYRSSYMNARRLTVTEGNIAYHTSDFERWQRMDFIVGVEISLSNNHTCKGADGKPHRFTDICDELAGKYPKDFKFTGWHPHCRCRCVPIFAKREEIQENRERIKAGLSPNTSVNAVKTMPKNFED